MLGARLFTASFGLTGPLFVPEYGSSPSLFGFTFGTYCSGVYEHFTWHRGRKMER